MVRDVEEGGERGEPDELRLGQIDAVVGRLRLDGLPDEPERRLAEIEEVHRHLGGVELLDEEAVRLHFRQAATGFADPPGDPLREVEIVACEVDVVRDEERSGAHGDGPGRRVHARRSEVGFATGRRDVEAQPLVLAPPDVGELHAVGPCRSGGVEVDGQVEPAGDPPPERAGEVHAVGERGLAERDEGDDVDRPDARMLPPVLLHVDLVDRHGYRPLEGVGDALGLPGEGQDAPVVAGIARPVEEMDTLRARDGVGEVLHDVKAPALAEVRHGFDEAHRPYRDMSHRPDAGAVGAGGARPTRGANAC